ncbi:MAG: hypothetical protein SPG09_09585 [Lachnospiraceae bacterium]|nr:hypothetical protein [bacterium]MDY5517844.1 hypothetical protein [Lachnospiraceae bacterium]
MKKAYTKPSIEMETFSPNEYIAACYAIINQMDTSNFVIRRDLANGKGTDGMNGRDKAGNYMWNRKGFEDDNIDILSHDWREIYEGSGDTTFYNGPGMNSSVTVQAWEANHDSEKGGTMVSHDATPVTITKITADNAAQYNTGVNAS